MTPATLQALRRLLFFSRQEAATLIAASPARPRGVSDRAWRMFEAGELPVPKDIAERIAELTRWRESALAAAEAQIADLRRQIPPGATVDLAMCWYDTQKDWMTLPGREPIHFRPQQSVIAEIAARHGARMVKFDVHDYSRWLGGRKDTEALRAAWAGEKS